MAANGILTAIDSPEGWDEVLAAFEHDLFGTGRSEPTVTTYASALRVFGRYYCENLKKPGPFASRIQETDLQAFIDHLRKDRLLRPTSINRYVAALRAFAAFLLTKRWHRRDVARHLRTCRVEIPDAPVCLSNNEQKRLVTSVNLNGRNGPRDLAILQLFLQCGLQVGELVRLCRDDVTLHKTTGQVRVRGETGRAERVITLNRTVRMALEGHLDRRGTVAGADPLFLSERRRRISVSTVQQLVKKYLACAGRDDLSVQDLRHQFALAFHARSGKLTATQQVLGHRNINTTARYARATKAEIEDAINRLDM